MAICRVESGTGVLQPDGSYLYTFRFKSKGTDHTIPLGVFFMVLTGYTQVWRNDTATDTWVSASSETLDVVSTTEDYAMYLRQGPFSLEYGCDIMTCTTLTVTAAAPVVTLGQYGFSVDGVNPTSCSLNAIGKSVAFYVQVISDKAGKVDVTINYTKDLLPQPGITQTVATIVGTGEVIIPAVIGTVYAAGTYIISSVTLSNARL